MSVTVLCMSVCNYMFLYIYDTGTTTCLEAPWSGIDLGKLSRVDLIGWTVP